MDADGIAALTALLASPPAQTPVVINGFATDAVGVVIEPPVFGLRPIVIDREDSWAWPTTRSVAESGSGRRAATWTCLFRHPQIQGIVAGAFWQRRIAAPSQGQLLAENGDNTHKSWFVGIAVAATSALFMASAPAGRAHAPGHKVASYAEWWVPYIGKAFYLSADWTVATEKARTSAVPVGAREFTLAFVGEDFVYFDDKEDRVCVPVVALRAIVKK